MSNKNNETRSREDQYDPKTCVTAGELRTMGLDIPSPIPNCAWVPRRAICFGEPEVTAEDDVVHASIPTIVNAPFKWVNVEVTFGSVEEAAAAAAALREEGFET